MRITKEFLAAQTPSETPYFVIQGITRGPVCIITAGIHGKEIAGILAAQQLADIKLKSGTLILVPVVNKSAYLKRIRGNPDLNRTFPRQANDSGRHPLAKELIRLIKQHRPAWCLDLHEATGFSSLNQTKLGQTLICYPEGKTVEVATQVVKEINRHVYKPYQRFTIRSGVLSGSFRTAAARLCKCHSITVETSMQLPLSTRIQYQRKIAETFLQRIGLT